jgi:hypothetical protein
MSVRVSSNGTELGRFELAQSVPQAVTVQLPAGPRELITFTFSDHAVDTQGRPVAFLVEETNLFHESDLYSLG